MGIVIRQSFWGTLLGYVGVAIGFLNAAILMPKFMTPDEIGIWRTLFSMSAFMMPFVLLGSQGTIIRFFPNLEENQKGPFLITLLIWVGSAFILIGALSLGLKDQLVELFEENGSVLENHFLFILVLLLAMVFYSLLEVTSRALLDVTTPNFIREVIYKSLNLSVIVAFGFDYISFEEYLHSQVGIYFLMIASLSFFVFSKENSKFSFSIKLDKNLKKEVFIYGAFAVMNGLGATLFMRIDTLMIAKFLNFSDVAVYTIAAYFVAVIEMPTKSITHISAPIITKALKENRMADIDIHYKASSINQMLVSALLFCGILVNIEEIYTLMPNGEIYRSGVIIVLILGCAKIIDGAFGINSSILSLSKYFRYNTLMLFAYGGGNIILNILFIPIWGVTGTAFATLITFLLFNISRYFLLKTKFGLDAVTSKTMVTVLFICIMITGCYWLDQIIYTAYLSILIKGTIVTILFYLFVVFYRPSIELERIRKQIINKIL